jgi:DNA-binding response OmpR family regulator
MNDKRPLSGKRLLVAEDEAVIAMDYTTMLSAAGAEIVGTARTSADVIAHLEESKVDAAILDFVLADGNSSALQAILTERRVPFVVISGYPSVLVRESEEQRVLHKPVNPDELCAAVLALCNGGS